MPYKFTTDKTKLPRNKDRRVKLTEEDEADIKSLHKEGIAIREIARRYSKISRRLIQFIIFPERRALASERLKEWQRVNGNFRKRVGNKRWAEVMREHRRYKQKVLNP